MNNPTATIPFKRQTMPVLPDDVVAYKQTPRFTQDTVPIGLLSDHTTKAGTWGVFNIRSGGLIYHIMEPGHYTMTRQTRCDCR